MQPHLREKLIGLPPELRNLALASYRLGRIRAEMKRRGMPVPPLEGSLISPAVREGDNAPPPPTGDGTMSPELEDVEQIKDDLADNPSEVIVRAPADEIEKR
jgi:hypothetical protein